MTDIDITEFLANAAKAEAAMNYPRCATCKWWGEYDGHPDNIGPGWGLCARFSEYWEDSGEKAYITAPFSTDGRLATAPDFGCVQHGPRDEPKAAT